MLLGIFVDFRLNFDQILNNIFLGEWDLFEWLGYHDKFCTRD